MNSLFIMLVIWPSGSYTIYQPFGVVLLLLAFALFNIGFGFFLKEISK